MKQYRTRLKMIEGKINTSGINDLFLAFGADPQPGTIAEFQDKLSRIEQLPTADILSGAGMEAAPL